MVVKRLYHFPLFLLLLSSVTFAQQPRLMLPIGHTAGINSAQFSPDGKKMVTASSDKTAKIWDVASGNLLTDLKGHTDPVTFAEFSPDGKRVLTASWDSTAKVWDAETGIVLTELKGNIAGVRTAQFSPDAKKILTVSNDTTVKIWDASTGDLLKEITGFSNTIYGAEFSPDGKSLVTRSWDDSTAKIWDAATGNLLADLEGHSAFVSCVRFSPAGPGDSTGGKKIITASYDKMVIIRDRTTWNIINKFKGHDGNILDLEFSPDGKKFVTASGDKMAKIWDAETGKLIAELKGHNANVISAQFSPDNKTVLTASDDKTAKIWNAENGKLLADLKGHTAELNSARFSPDGMKIATASDDKTARIWDANTGKILAISTGHTNLTYTAQFSPDNKKIITEMDGQHPCLVWDAGTGKLITHLTGDTSRPYMIQFSPDGTKVVVATRKKVQVSESEEDEVENLKIWNVATGKLIAELKGTELLHGLIKFSADGKKLVTTSGDNIAMIWDANTGKHLANMTGHIMYIRDAVFSPDGQKLLTASEDLTAKVWNVATGKLLLDLTDFKYGVSSAQFSPACPDDPRGGKKILTVANQSYAQVWNALTGKLVFDLQGHTWTINSAQFSPDGKEIVTASEDSTARTWDAATGKQLAVFKGHTSRVNEAQFSPDSKKILSSSYFEKNAIIWDAATGNLLKDLEGHNDIINDASYSPDGKSIVTVSQDNTIKKWDAGTGKCLYTFFGVDKDDYLVVDNKSHYDGTQAARKLLYFICGSEIVALDQVKDQLWVPNLAERINSGDSINAKTLDELNLCGLTPEIEDASGNTDEYDFKIRPRRGGLGQINLTINGALTTAYQPGDLTKNAGVYELKISKEKLNMYFSDGSLNKITIKANTADNTVSSREITINIDKTAQPAVPPNLYAVMVGVSDYKGDELDLQYAAIDATDVSTTLAAAARKLLNYDGKEHVFMYNLTTAKDHYLLPEKKSIKAVLDSIGKKATANDILFIFLSGHGVMEGDKKLFYFLTADASSASATDAFADVGISTTELTEWIKPQNIKAQKRILVMDACNSGQAIKDFVSIGNAKEGFIAAKGDDQAQQVKAIDKLNEQSGLFILSAAASDQNAYESADYSHGYLTYSLLKAIKQEPDILEDGKYLDISRWFNAAGKTVSDMAKDDRNKQEPQIVTNTDFNIGVVDAEVMGNIKLSSEKSLFSSSNFLNRDEVINDDDLELGKMINQQLSDISTRGADSKTVFVVATNSPVAYALTGSYIIKGSSITVKANVKQGKEIKYRFELNGTKDKLKELVADICQKATAWTGGNK